MKTKFKIQNIVATATLEKPISLTNLARKCPIAEYNPEKFPGLFLRIKEPKSVVIVFSSGKLVCMGTKSIAQSKQALEIAIKQIQRIRK